MLTNFIHVFGDTQGVSLNRQMSVSDVIESTDNRILIPQKYKADVDALESYINTGLESGVCISLTLSDILKICPRERRRVDSYNALCRYLREKLGVELNIKSQKTKRT